MLLVERSSCRPSCSQSASSNPTLCRVLITFFEDNSFREDSFSFLSPTYIYGAILCMHIIIHIQSLKGSSIYIQGIDLPAIHVDQSSAVDTCRYVLVQFVSCTNSYTTSCNYNKGIEMLRRLSCVHIVWVCLT